MRDARTMMRVPLGPLDFGLPLADLHFRAQAFVSYARECPNRMRKLEPAELATLKQLLPKQELPECLL